MMVLATLWVACGRETFATDLTEDEANRVLFALQGAGIAAKKEQPPTTGAGAGGAPKVWRVTGSQADTPRALAVLQHNDLPNRHAAGLGEVFDGTGLVPTPTEERARLMSALSGEVAASLESIEGVLDAKVHVALPPHQTTLSDTPPEPKASVLIKTDRNTRPSSERIQQLVAGAVHGLRPDQVAVWVAPTPHAPRRRFTPDLVQLGPVTITRSSLGAVKALGATLLSIFVAMAACVLWVLHRTNRSARPEGTP